MTAVTVVANVGNVPTESGSPHSSHLIYATNTGRWWCFWLDAAAATVVKARVSSSADLATATWADPTNPSSGTWPNSGAHENDGLNLYVAYKSIGGVDVVHLACEHHEGGSNYHTTIRLTLSGTTVTWGSWDQGGIMNAGEYPIGGAIAFSSTNYIHQSSSFLDAQGNFDVCASSNADTGAAWTTGYAAFVQAWSAAQYCNSNAIFDIGSGNMLAICEDGADAPNMNDQVFAVSAAQTWTAGAGAAVYGSTSSQAPNDWGAVARITTDVHIVRRTGATTFVHRRWNGTNWTSVAGDSIPSSGLTGHLAGSGVFLATDTTDVWLFMIDTDANHTIRYSRWISGTGWAAWADLTTNTNVKHNISGQQLAANTQINVIWTDGTATPFALITSSLALSAAPVVTTAACAATAVLTMVATVTSDMQTAAPVTLVANPGGWTDDLGSSVAADLVAALATAGGRYLISPALGVGNSASITFHLGTLATPSAGTRTLKVTPAKDVASGTLNFTINLREGQGGGGGTLVQTWGAGYLDNVDTSGAEVDLTETGDPPDWGNLDVEIVASQSA